MASEDPAKAIISAMPDLADFVLHSSKKKEGTEVVSFQS